MVLRKQPRYLEGMDPVLAKKDPLRIGKPRTWSLSVPPALVDEIQRAAVIDGFAKVSPYVVELLIYALRAREAERAKELSAKAR